MKRFELVVEWGEASKFRYGYDYTIDEVLQTRYISPRGVDEILNCMVNVLKVDYQRFIQPHLYRLRCNILYRLEAYEAIYVHGVRLVKMSFIAVTIGAFGAEVNHLPTPNNPTYVPVKDVSKAVKDTGKVTAPLVGAKTQVVKPKKGKPKKQSVPLALEQIKSKLDYYERKIIYNPKNEYDRVYVEKLPNPKSDSTYAKFASYSDGVLYFYYLAKYHNLTQTNKVNVRAYMAQIGIEAGLRPINRGYISKLSTFANNPHGGKTFNSSDAFIWSKDDAYKKDKKGNLVKTHSKFKIFESFNSAIQDYANLIANPRYRGKVEVEYSGQVVVDGKYVTAVTILKNDISPYMDSADWYACIHGLRVSGYCTAPLGQYERQCNVAYKEQSKVLVKHQIFE